MQRRGAGDRAEENHEARQRPLFGGGCEDDFVYRQKCCSRKRKLTMTSVSHLPTEESRHLSRQH